MIIIHNSARHYGSKIFPCVSNNMYVSDLWNPSPITLAFRFVSQIYFASPAKPIYFLTPSSLLAELYSEYYILYVCRTWRVCCAYLGRFVFTYNIFFIQHNQRVRIICHITMHLCGHCTLLHRRRNNQTPSSFIVSVGSQTAEVSLSLLCFVIFCRI